MGTWSVSDDQIALTSPQQFDPDDVGLSLHLYHLQESAHHADGQPPATYRDDDPLVLELFYLLTAHPANGDTIETSDTLEQHRMLSKAAQTLRRHAIVKGPDMQGSLTGGEPLHITINTDATDHVMDVWSSFPDTPYLPSISYSVNPVVIETEEAAPSPRVTTATMELGDAGE